MPYIGNQLATQFQAFVTQTITGDGSTGYTLDRAVANGKELLVYINNVKQEEGSGKSYTASGTTITFSEAVASGDSCYLVYLGSAVQTVVPPDGSLASYTGNATFSGDVGIRTTSPSDNLELTPSADEKGITLKTTDNVRPYFNLDANRSSAGNNLAHINFKWNGTEVARIIGVAGADTTNKDDAHITFQTASAGSPSERMRIDSSGNILVGKTSSDGSAAGHEMRPTSFAIHTRDNGAPLGVRRIGSGTNDEGNYIFFENASADVGQIGYVSTGFFIQGESSHSGFRFGGSQIVPFRDGSDSDDTTDLGASGVRFDDIFATNTSISSSDANKKNTIIDSDLGLDFINRLSPKSYIFNGKTRVHYGLIAQEVENVLSDINKPTSKFAGFVKDEKENFYGLRYAEFISPMIQAIKDLKAEVDTLKDKVKELESK